MNNDNSETYTPRSILRLNGEISSCTNAEQRLVLFAKKAGSLARHSYLIEAQAIIKELRVINSGYDPQLSAWIMFSEGMIEHFSTLNNAKSKDKFVRAFLIGQVACDRELAGAAAAWLAHCEFVAGQMKAAVEHVATAFKWSDEDGGEARGRACMVLADTLNWVGKTELARHWYREARKHAVRDGDIAMQNVMLFNIAAFGVSQLNLKDCSAPATPEDWRMLSLEVASANNLNIALSIQSLDSMIPIMRAELLVAKRLWTDAIDLFDQYIPSVTTEGQGRLLAKLLAQSAWCRANIGELGRAGELVREAISHIDECLDLDDLAVAHFRISATGKILNDNQLEMRHENLAAESLRLFRNQQIEIEAMVNSALSEIEASIKNPA